MKANSIRILVEDGKGEYLAPKAIPIILNLKVGTAPKLQKCARKYYSPAALMRRYKLKRNK
jgi:hypothetical protein